MLNSAGPSRSRRCRIWTSRESAWPTALCYPPPPHPHPTHIPEPGMWRSTYPRTAHRHRIATPDTWAEKFEVFERINSIRKTKENFDSCNSRKRMKPAVYLTYMSPNFRLFLASNLSVQKIRIFLLEFIRSKLSNISAHVSCDSLRTAGRLAVRRSARSGGQMSRHNVRPGEWGGQQRAVNRASSRGVLDPPSAWEGRELFTGESSPGFCEWFKVQ